MTTIYTQLKETKPINKC